MLLLAVLRDNVVSGRIDDAVASASAERSQVIRVLKREEVTQLRDRYAQAVGKVRGIGGKGSEVRAGRMIARWTRRTKRPGGVRGADTVVACNVGEVVHAAFRLAPAPGFVGEGQLLLGVPGRHWRS